MGIDRNKLIAYFLIIVSSISFLLFGFRKEGSVFLNTIWGLIVLGSFGWLDWRRSRP